MTKLTRKKPAAPDFKKVAVKKPVKKASRAQTTDTRTYEDLYDSYDRWSI